MSQSKARIFLFTIILLMTTVTTSFAQDSSHVTLIGSCSLPAPASLDLATFGQYAYVANGWNGLQVVDFSNPTTPHIVRSIPTNGFPESIVISGNLAYVTDGYGGLIIFDLTNPTNPVLIGACSSPNHNYRSLALQGGYVYVAAGINGLRIINISNPASPQPVGAYTTSSSAADVAVSGNLAFVSYLGGLMQVVNIGNPANPTFVSSCILPGDGYGIAVSGNYVYYAGTGLGVIDVSNPSQPQYISNYSTLPVVNIKVLNNIAYVAGYETGLRVVRIRNPLLPVELGYYHRVQQTWGVTLSNQYILTAENDNGTGAFGIYTISKIELVSPLGGGETRVGQIDTIRWSSENVSGTIRIEINRDYPNGNWETLIANSANDGVEQWNVSWPITNHARIKIAAETDTSIKDISDADFTIYTPLIRPNGGETFIIDEPDTIRWNFPTLTSGIATIKINRGYPNALWQLVASSVPIAQGYRAWTPNGTLTNTARIAIIPAGANAYLADTSDANFSILPRFIQVTCPNGGELILTGQPDTIRWNAPYPGTLAIYLSRLGQDYGQLELITDSVYAPTGQYVWTPTGPISDSCYLYIGDILNPVEDWSDNRFRIVNSTITITKPNDGEVFYFGLPDTVKWTSVNLTGNVAIDLRRTVTGDWMNLFPSRPNSGETIWWPTGTSTISAKVRVRSLLEPGTSDTSDFAFSIQNYPWSTLLRYLARNPHAISNPNAAWAPPIPYDVASNNYPPLEVAFPEQDVGHANPDSIVTSYSAIASDELSISRSINRIWSVAPSNQQFENATLTLRFVQTDLPPTITDPITVNPPLRAVFSEDEGSTWIFIPGGTVYRDTLDNNTYRFVIEGLQHMSRWAITNSGYNPALIYPNGNETITLGDTVTFRWSNAIRGGTVSIAINRTYPSGEWETILSNTPNDSLEQWLVSGDATTNARFRIVSDWFAGDGDTTDTAVTIQNAPNPPQTPENVSITPIGNHIRIQWSAVDSSILGEPISITGYRIDSRDDYLLPWQPLRLVEPMTSPAHIDSNAALLTSQRYYQIRALLNATDAVSTKVRRELPNNAGKR